MKQYFLKILEENNWDLDYAWDWDEFSKAQTTSGEISAASKGFKCFMDNNNNHIFDVNSPLSL
jgi:hypothetical protein